MAHRAAPGIFLGMPMPTYQVQPLDIGRTGNFQLTADEYHSIERSVQVFVHTIWQEEKFRILVENYVSFYDFILSEGLTHVLDARKEIDTLHFRLGSASRHVMNFLTSFRLYRDALKENTACIFGDKNAEKAPLEKLKEVYDNDFAYRMIHQLRNHAQHCALPVQRGSFGSVWNDERTRYSIKNNFFVDYDALKRDQGFPEKLLDEARRNYSSLDLFTLLGTGLDTLGEIHHWWRYHCGDILLNAERTFGKFFERVRSERYDETNVFVKIVDIDTGERLREISSFQFSYLDHLRSIIAEPRGLGKRRIEIPDPRDI